MTKEWQEREGGLPNTLKEPLLPNLLASTYDANLELFNHMLSTAATAIANIYSPIQINLTNELNNRTKNTFLDSYNKANDTVKSYANDIIQKASDENEQLNDLPLHKRNLLFSALLNTLTEIITSEEHGSNKVKIDVDEYSKKLIELSQETLSFSKNLHPVLRMQNNVEALKGFSSKALSQFYEIAHPAGMPTPKMDQTAYQPLQDQKGQGKV